MDWDGPRRRGFLGGMVATIAGISGCQTRSGDRPGDTTAETVETQGTEPSTVDGFHHPATVIVYNRDGQTHALDASTGDELFAGEAAHEVIQRAIDAIDGGTVFLAAGEYTYGPPGIHLRSNTRLVGAGRGATILRLEDGVNGRRGEVMAPALRVGQTVEDVTIANLEIDGNESGNRGVPPYPMSPHHHGIMIHGNEPQVPEDEKPANVTVRNVSVHDTVRSNVVLAGRNCELDTLWLSNSATDHWLYLAGASLCRVSGVHASGFARTSGIVFGVGERRAFGTTLEDVTISNVRETPYQNEQGPGLAGRYPVRAVTMRPSSANAYENTLRNIQIRIPDAVSGATVHTLQPNTRIEGLTYRGPAGETGIVYVDDRAAETTVTDTTIEITGSGQFDPAGIVEAHGPDLTIADSRLEATDDRSLAGVLLGEGPEPVARAVLRNLRIGTAGPVIRADRGEYGIPDLVVDSVFDLRDSGTAGFDRIDPRRVDIY